MSFGLDDDDGSPKKKAIRYRRNVQPPELRVIDIAGENPEWLDAKLAHKIDPDMIDWENVEAFLPSACMKGYRQKKYLGRGSYGSVFQVCKDDDCKKALKIVPLGARDEEELNDNIDKFEYESQYGFIMGYHGIGPTVYDYWFCPKIAYAMGESVQLGPAGMIVMQKMDMDLHDYAEEQIRDILHEYTDSRRRELALIFLQEMNGAEKTLKRKLRRMSKIKYNGNTFVHGDIHGGNIMVNVKPGSDVIDHIEDVRFVDFGNINEDTPEKDAMDDISDTFSAFTSRINSLH